MCLLFSYIIRGFQKGARHVVKFLLCVFVVCISTLQDSSVSIFDQLSGLIADSLLCPRSNFGDYPITACAPANKRRGWGLFALR